MDMQRRFRIEGFVRTSPETQCGDPHLWHAPCRHTAHRGMRTPNEVKRSTTSPAHTIMMKSKAYNCMTIVPGQGQAALLGISSSEDDLRSLACRTKRPPPSQSLHSATSRGRTVRKQLPGPKLHLALISGEVAARQLMVPANNAGEHALQSRNHSAQPRVPRQVLAESVWPGGDQCSGRPTADPPPCQKRAGHDNLGHNNQRIQTTPAHSYARAALKRKRFGYGRARSRH